jgi:OOP family OmpA-OmpF porin
MKKTVIALVAALSVIPAMAGEAYVGAGVGRAGQHLEIIDPAFGSLEGSTSSAKLFGGYQFTPVFGTEIGYSYFGRGTFVSVGNGAMQAQPSSIYAAMTGTWSVTSDFAAYGKVGVARNHLRASDMAEVAETTNHTRPMFGVGVKYSLNKAVSIFGEYENYGKVEKDPTGYLKVTQVAFGARYKF